MKRLYQLLVPLASVAISLGMALPGFAQPAKLVAQDRDSQINVRAQPTTASRANSYGYSGDRIEVLNIVKGEDGYFWFQVEFNTSGAKGWVRGDFIQLLN